MTKKEKLFIFLGGLLGLFFGICVSFIFDQFSALGFIDEAVWYIAYLFVLPVLPGFALTYFLLFLDLFIIFVAESFLGFDFVTTSDNIETFIIPDVLFDFGVVIGTLFFYFVAGIVIPLLYFLLKKFWYHA